jgi:hypothetical protein
VFYGDVTSLGRLGNKPFKIRHTTASPTNWTLPRPVAMAEPGGFCWSSVLQQSVWCASAGVDRRLVRAGSARQPHVIALQKDATLQALMAQASRKEATRPVIPPVLSSEKATTEPPFYIAAQYRQAAGAAAAWLVLSVSV